MSTTDPAGGVDQQRAVGHRGEEGGVDHAGGLRGDRDDEDDDVGVRQELRQLRRGADAVPRGARHVGELDVEAGEHAADRPADVAGADDQHPRPHQRGVGRERPAAGVLLADEERDAALRGEGGRHGPLRRGRRVRAAGVAEDDAVGQPPERTSRRRRLSSWTSRSRGSASRKPLSGTPRCAVARDPHLRLRRLPGRRAVLGVDRGGPAPAGRAPRAPHRSPARAPARAGSRPGPAAGVPRPPTLGVRVRPLAPAPHVLSDR